MIKNIIFDMGGVVLNLDYELTIEAFKKLGASGVDAVYAGAKAAQFFDDFECGLLTEAEFRSQLRQHFDLVATDAELDKAWNAMLLDLPQERLDFIKSLRENFNVYLFSNTNSIHLRAIEAICDQGQGFAAFQECFDKDFYSHIVGARKPNVTAFQKVLQQAGIESGETVFIDDNFQNVEGARLAGMHAVHLHGDMDLREVLRQANQINEQEMQEQKASRLGLASF